MAMDKQTLTSSYIWKDPVLLPQVDRAKCYLAERRPVMVGMSPGNSYYYKPENIQRMLEFANSHSKHVKVFVPDVIAVHNYRAIRSSKPEKIVRRKCKDLMNRFKSVVNASPPLLSSDITFVNWRTEVETSEEYARQLDYIETLFENNEQFHSDALEVSTAAVESVLKWKNGGNKGSISEITTECNDERRIDVSIASDDGNDHSLRIPIEEEDYDIKEGLDYLFKEFAFFLAIPSIYQGFDKFVYIYHRPWPILENMINGVYDNIVRTYMGFFVLV